MPGLADGGGVQGKVRPAGQPWVVTRFLQGWHAVQGKRFAPGVGSDGDAVGNRSRLQVIEAGTGFQVQVGVLRVVDQQAAAFQHPYDAAGEGIEQVIEFLTGGPAGAVKDGPRAVMAAAVTFDAQEAVLQQAAFQVLIELPADESGEMTTRSLDFLDESRVVPVNDGIKLSLLRLVTVVGGSCGNRVRSGQRSGHRS